MAEGSTGHSHTPSFFKILFPDFSTKLQLPRSFVEKHISEDEKTARATLVSPDGKIWFVSLLKNHIDFYLSGDQWFACAEALNLKVGFLLLFSYEGRMVFSFKVFDLSTCEKTYPPSSVHVSTEGPKFCKDGHSFQLVSKNQGRIISYCKDCRCTRFESSVFRSNIRDGYLELPVQFIKLSGLSKRQNNVTLVDAAEGSWTISLSRSYTRANRIRKGVTQFFRDNRLKLGDRYVFEIEEGKKNVIHVKIFKA